MKSNLDLKAIGAAISGALTRNWGLKLIALILAIVIYYVLVPTTGTEHESQQNVQQHFIKR